MITVSFVAGIIITFLSIYCSWLFDRFDQPRQTNAKIGVIRLAQQHMYGTIGVIIGISYSIFSLTPVFNSSIT